MFISHDLGVVEHVAERVLVMYRGRVVEIGPATDLFRRPAHPYTRALVDALPDFDAEPDPAAGPPLKLGETSGNELEGCALADRCPLAVKRCRVERPELLPIVGDQRRAACFEPLA